MNVQALDTLFMVMSFALGATIGSFLNVCIYRLPRNLSVVHPRSACPKCGTPIAWYDNIPIVSWLILGAKCRKCGNSISWHYPFVEALTGTLFLLLYWKHGFVLATPVYMIVTASLVLVTFVDLSDWIIPNEVTYPGVPLGIVWSIVVMFGGPATGGVIPHAYETVFDALLGAVLGGGSLYLLDLASLWLLGKKGMGLGDVKLMAMLGAFFGWKGAILIIMMASIMGSVVGIAMIAYGHYKGAPPEQEGEQPEAASDDKKGLADEEDEPIPVDGHYLPFGPYLSIAGIIVMFYGQEIFQMYYAMLTVPGTTSPLAL